MACRAALLIHETFAAAQLAPGDPLHGYQIGIGIGHGQAIAGRIGSLEQIKVGVFGPVVNLASRLQDMTKQVGVPILLDGATAEAARDALSADEAALREVGRFRPAGVENAVDVFALIPVGDSTTTLSPDQLRVGEAAVAAVGKGDWARAELLLRDLPPDDKPSAFLRKALAEAGGEPPPNWDGVLSIEREGAVRFKTGKATRVNLPIEK
jgi:adenylate cyclase